MLTPEEMLAQLTKEIDQVKSLPKSGLDVHEINSCIGGAAMCKAVMEGRWHKLYRPEDVVKIEYWFKRGRTWLSGARYALGRMSRRDSQYKIQKRMQELRLEYGIGDKK